MIEKAGPYPVSLPVDSITSTVSLYQEAFPRLQGRERMENPQEKDFVAPWLPQSQLTSSSLHTSEMRGDAGGRTFISMASRDRKLCGAKDLFLLAC